MVVLIFTCPRFQSTLPRGERLFFDADLSAQEQFQSTLPRGERPIPMHRRNGSENFNPRSHEGSDPAPSLRMPQLFYFNPRSHEGSDLYSTSSLWMEWISIHAPTRGATRTVSSPCFSSSFQSTLPRGERPIYLHHLTFTARFQSTLPRGERQNVSSLFQVPTSFQSTLPRGERRGNGKSSSSSSRISIHAPTRGATFIDHFTSEDSDNFNPRSHEGSDPQHS